MVDRALNLVSQLKTRLAQARKPRVPQQVLTIFFRQLATMLGSGVGILRAVDVSASQCDNRLLKSALQRVQSCVDRGLPLSRAMARCPEGVFSLLHCNLVRAGELSGSLPLVLDQVAGFEERDLSLRRRIASALTYPAFIITAALVVLLILLRFVLPSIVATVASLPGAALPWPTRVVMALSHFAYSPLALPALACASAASWGFGKMFLSTPLGKYQLDEWKISLPLVGKYLKQSVIVRLCWMLETLYRSGVPTLPAIKIIAQVSGNECFKESLMNIALDRLVDGATFSRALELCGLFPPLVTQMVWAGEETGKLAYMLHHAAEMYRLEMECNLNQMTSLLEPLLILVLGLVTCFILLAAMLPVYQVISHL